MTDDKKRAKRYADARESIEAGVDARIVLAWLELQEAIDASGHEVKPIAAETEMEQKFSRAYFRIRDRALKCRRDASEGGDADLAAVRIRRAAADLRRLGPAPVAACASAPAAVLN